MSKCSILYAYLILTLQGREYSERSCHVSRNANAIRSFALADRCNRLATTRHVLHYIRSPLIYLGFYKSTMSSVSNVVVITHRQSERQKILQKRNKKMKNYDDAA